MIQVIKRALKVLEIVAQDPQEARVLGEIARQAGLKPATCSHIVKTLLSAGYLEQARKRGGYVLGHSAYRLSKGATYRGDLLQRAVPLMDGLAARLEETVILATMVNGRRIVLHESTGSGALRIAGKVIQEANPYVTATGRVLIAGLQDDALDGIFSTFGPPGLQWANARTRRAFDGGIAEVRRQGYAIAARGEVTGIAFPVKEGGRASFALGLYLPAFKFTGRHKQTIMKEMQKCAQEISSGCGATVKTAGKESEV